MWVCVCVCVCVCMCKLSNGWTLDMEQATNIRIWNRFQCHFHKFLDFNAVFFSITKITIRLSKMARTEDGAGVFSQSYVTLDEVYNPSLRIIAFVIAITWSSCETLYEVVTYLITFDGLTSNYLLSLHHILIRYFLLYLYK